MQARPKILRISPTPSLARAYRKQANLNAFCYDDQVQALKNEGFILPGSWSEEMATHGFDVMDVLFPDIALMARWAREHGLNNLALNPDPVGILSEMVRDYQPDVVFIYAGAFFHITRQIRDALRGAGGPQMVITGFWGDELNRKLYTYERYFGDLDFVFVSSPLYQKRFEEVGIEAILSGNAFDPSIEYSKPAEKDIDLLFCGTTGYRVPEHMNRYRILKKIIPRTNLILYSSEPKAGASTGMKGKVLKLGGILPEFAWRVANRLAKSRLRRFLPPSVPFLTSAFLNVKRTGIPPWVLLDRNAHPEIGKFDFLQPLAKLFPKRFRAPLTKASDYQNLLARAKIAINIHRDEDADIGNIRCFEVTGVGTCLLTDRARALADRFEEGEEIVGFDTAEDLIAKVDHLMRHPEELDRIAKAGQRRTLRDHTVAQRCEMIARKLRLTLASYRPLKQVSSSTARSVLIAKYDTQGQPISYDISFFLQAAEIRRKQENCDRLIVALVPPEDMNNQPGVSNEVNAVVDGDSRRFRMSHILGQMADMMPNTDVLHMKSRHIDPYELAPRHMRAVFFPEDGIPHHSTYFQLVNKHPQDIAGFEASSEAHKYVAKWLAPIARDRRVLCLSLRQYKVDIERNNNIAEWHSFFESLDPTVYCVVIVPDTDAVNAYQHSALAKYPMFYPACFDVDLRFALYEQAYLNLFVNNGPCVAATLSKKINYLMFKLVVKDVATTDPAFIKMLGFEIGKTPAYATPTQKWVWQDDRADIIVREFATMEAIIRTARAA